MRRGSRRRFLRRATVAGLALSLAGCSGSDGDGTDTASPGRTATDGETATDTPTATPEPTTVPPHTTSEPPGRLAVGASTARPGEETSHQVTVPVDGSLSGQQLEEVAVTYPAAFSVDSVDEETVRALVGEEGGEATEAPVGGVATAETETESEVSVTVDESAELDDAYTVVVEYDGVETPDRRGDYTVWTTVNDEVTEVGSVTVSEEPIAAVDQFQESIAGWRVAGDAQGNSAFPNHDTEAGQQAPCLRAVDDTVGGVWYWVAPLKYLGDRSEYVGGTLSFDLRQSRFVSQFDSTDVVIRAEGGGGLLYDFGDTETHPATDWSSYEVPLEPADGWRYNPEGETLETVRSGYADLDAADEATFREVLGAVDGLYVRGEYVSGSDTGWLDNVSMTPP